MKTKINGFTLIELVIVIALIGVVMITGSAKFMNLQSDARKAAIETAKSALDSAFKMLSIKSQLPSSEILKTGNIKLTKINNVYIRINDDFYPIFATFAHGNELYGLDTLKAIVDMDIHDSNNDRAGVHNLNYTFDSNGGFVIFTKIDDYNNSKCYLQYAPDKVHDLIDDLPDGEYFQIITSGC